MLPIDGQPRLVSYKVYFTFAKRSSPIGGDFFDSKKQYHKIMGGINMQYLSGIHALNLQCSLDTSGDWHQSALRWKDLDWRESDGSLWGDYGIEENSHIPEHPGTYKTANHIRALLDLLVEGNTALAQGMRKQFIDNEKYTPEIFSKVLYMKDLPIWSKIDEFMGKEYFRKWLTYKESVDNGIKLA